MYISMKQARLSFLKIEKKRVQYPLVRDPPVSIRAVIILERRPWEFIMRIGVISCKVIPHVPIKALK